MIKGIEFGKSIVKEIDKRVKRTYWTNDQIDNLFGQRSVQEILDSRETCFMNPCSDMTFVSSFLISQYYIPHRWVVENHPPTESFDFNRLHFVLEYIHDKRLYVLNYKKLNDVHIYEGSYEGRKDIPGSKIIRIPRKEIHFNRSLKKNLSAPKIKEKLEGYSLEKNLERLKKDNSIENFNNFQKLYGSKFIFKSA